MRRSASRRCRSSICPSAIGRRKRASWLRWQLGAQLFLLGLFKKLAIADRMAQFADPVFRDPGAYGSGALWLAVLAYAMLR